MDLLGRINSYQFESIYDLGCGTGNITKIIHDKWPNSSVTGVDSSEEMLGKAKTDYKEIKWELADLNIWEPTIQPDLLFSNATLHWLDDHKSLFPRLMKILPSGGLLAIQMPNNYKSPSHSCILDTILSREWGADLEKIYRYQPVLNPSEYHQILESISSEVWIWETTYWHVLEGANPVVQWTKGSALRFYLELLSPKLASDFELEYSKRIYDAYRPINGKTYFPFRRLFMVAIAN